MQKGQLNDAIPWLESAKKAKRYDPRHYPYLNLGKVYLAKGERMRALDEFRKRKRYFRFSTLSLG